MPNRIIRAGIISSDRVNCLDYAAEVFYRRLLNMVDDHGLYDARPSILRATLYPLRIDRVREADISRWLTDCQTAGLILLYEAESKPYLKVLNTQWESRSKPKYPQPSKNGSGCVQLQTDVSNCEQLSPYSGSLSNSNSGSLSAKNDDGLSGCGLSDAVAQAMGMKTIPEGKPGEKLRAITEDFRLAGINPVDVSEFTADWYARKMKAGRPNSVLLPDYLATDLPGWVKAKRLRTVDNAGNAGTDVRKLNCAHCQDTTSITVKTETGVRYVDCPQCQPGENQ